MASARYEAVVDPGFLEGLRRIPLDEIRARRREADEIETGLSYLRRLVQGRLDILRAEGRRRQAGDGHGGAAAMVERLPEILADHVHAPGAGRLPTLLTPGEVDVELSERLDTIARPSKLASLPAVTDDELGAAMDGLAGLEREVSARRRTVHRVLDQLQDETVRRYRTGEATVDNLLA